MIYEYNLTDHLGNTRITFGDADDDGLADILQENHYYPFGMAMTMSSTLAAAPPNNYLYNGKELQDELDLGWYDYGARMYDASIGRWNGVDALAEKYVGWSTYNNVMGNPIKMIDPDGNRVIWSPLLTGYLPSGFISALSATGAFNQVYQPFLRNYDNVTIQYEYLNSRTVYGVSYNTRQTNGYLISVNSQLFSGGELYVDPTNLAGIIIHEGIHSRKRWQWADAKNSAAEYPGNQDFYERRYDDWQLYNESAPGQAEHTQMAVGSRATIVEGMKEFDSNFGSVHSEDWYQAMSWASLRRTTAWNEFSSSNQERATSYTKIIENEEATEEVKRTFAVWQENGTDASKEAYQKALGNWNEELYNSTRR